MKNSIKYRNLRAFNFINFNLLKSLNFSKFLDKLDQQCVKSLQINVTSQLKTEKGMYR